MKDKGYAKFGVGAGGGGRGANKVHYGKCVSGVLSVFTHVTSMRICWNKRKRWCKKRVQLPWDWFGTPTWPPLVTCGAANYL